MVWVEVHLLPEDLNRNGCTARYHCETVVLGLLDVVGDIEMVAFFSRIKEAQNIKPACIGYVSKFTLRRSLSCVVIDAAQHR